MLWWTLWPWHYTPQLRCPYANLLFLLCALQVAACSHEIYEEILGIGPDDHHDSCTNNLHNSLAVRLLRKRERKKDTRAGQEAFSLPRLSSEQWHTLHRHMLHYQTLLAVL